MKRAHCKVDGVDRYKKSGRITFGLRLVGSDLVIIYDSRRLPIEGRTIVGAFAVFENRFQSGQ